MAHSGLTQRPIECVPELTAHRYVVLKLRMSGAVSLLLQYAFMAWTETFYSRSLLSFVFLTAFLLSLLASCISIACFKLSLTILTQND